jgi:hypothetical protein
LFALGVVAVAVRASVVARGEDVAVFIVSVSDIINDAAAGGVPGLGGEVALIVVAAGDAAGKAAKASKIEAVLKAGRTPPVVNKGGRPKGIPNKVTPTVATMILQMKAERKKVTLIARELNLSRQTVYEVLRRA